MSEFEELLLSLGFQQYGDDQWIYKGPAADGVHVGINGDDVSANYSSEYSNEDDVVYYDGSVYNLHSFAEWFDSL